MKQFKNIVFGSLLTLFLWVLSFAEVAAQCPMCKAAVTGAGHDNQESALAGGLNGGILYLFVLPYLAATMVGVWWYTKYKKAKKEEKNRQENERKWSDSNEEDSNNDID